MRVFVPARVAAGGKVCNEVCDTTVV
jgi:uncharacterized protein (TIGR02284 family)